MILSSRIDKCWNLFQLSKTKVIYLIKNNYSLKIRVLQGIKLFILQLAFEIKFQELGVHSKSICKWRNNSQNLACFGSEYSVIIYWRKGEKVSSFAVNSSHQNIINYMISKFKKFLQLKALIFQHFYNFQEIGLICSKFFKRIILALWLLFTWITSLLRYSWPGYYRWQLKFKETTWSIFRRWICFS
jgi:hypothetical protein